ncbi:MAG: uroporphyrinogen-III synthase [Pseudomonadota bacterium]
MQKPQLLLTRPLGMNAEFAARFPKDLAHRLQFIDCPLIRIVSLQGQNGLEGDAQAIFTSSNGVRFAPPSLGRLAYCVGERTTEAARNAGWFSVHAGKNAVELIEYIAARDPKESLYHLCGKHQRGNVVEALIAKGMRAKRVVLYDQQLLPVPAGVLDSLKRDTPTIVPLFSPRGAAHFAGQVPESPRATVIAMSDAVAKAVRSTSDLKTVTCAHPTANAMLEAIENLTLAHRLG